MEQSSFGEKLSAWGNKLLAQSAEMGAMPTVYAAAAVDVDGGDYIGPSGFLEFAGDPVKVKSNARSYDIAVAGKLWAVSEELTETRFATLD